MLNIPQECICAFYQLYTKSELANKCITDEHRMNPLITIFHIHMAINIKVKCLLSDL